MPTKTALPSPTTDLDRAKADLAEHGYCLVANALSPDEVAAIRGRLVEAAAEDIADGVGLLDGGGAFASGGPNQRVWQLLNRGEEFRRLAAHPLTLEIMGHLLGGHGTYGATAEDGLPQFLLSSITANIAGPAGGQMVLHTDQGHVPFPWPTEYPLVANTNWMLDDFTATNGATRVVPGSHRIHAPPDADALTRAVPAEGPAGTALFFEGRVWHGTGPNTTSDQRRHGILAYYCKPWLRQQDNPAWTFNRALLPDAPPALLRLLGLDGYYGDRRSPTVRSVERHAGLV